MFMTISLFIFTEHDDRPHVTLRILAGATTGCLAVLVAQPTDVVKIRMQADMSSRGARRYTGSINAYRNIGKHEGIKGLWKGKFGALDYLLPFANEVAGR